MAKTASAVRRLPDIAFDRRRPADSRPARRRAGPAGGVAGGGENKHDSNGEETTQTIARSGNSGVAGIGEGRPSLSTGLHSQSTSGVEEA